MITKGKKVKIHYVLIVNGETIDSSSETGPLEYEHGSGQIILGLEKALEGRKLGDECDVHIGPEDAYGPINPKAILEIPKDKVDSPNLQPGMVLKGVHSTGEEIQGIVREIREEVVVVDFNHPLAGKELHFQVKVEQIS